MIHWKYRKDQGYDIQPMVNSIMDIYSYLNEMAEKDPWRYEECLELIELGKDNN